MKTEVTARGVVVNDVFNLKKGMRGVVRYTQNTKDNNLVMFYPDSGKPYRTCVDLENLDIEKPR